MRLSGAIFPLEDEPEHERGAEGGESVDLAFDSREPESIAPCIGKRTADSRAEDDKHLDSGHLGSVILDDETLDEMGNRPEQQQNRACGKEGRHGIDHDGDLADVAAGEIHEETGGKHEDGVARRVAHFKFKTLRNKFGTVPETRRGFKCQQIGDSGDDKAQPPERIVDNIVFFHNQVITTRKVSKKF